MDRLCRQLSDLPYLCLSMYSGVQHILCFFVLFVFVLCFMYTMLPISLYFPFVFAPSVFFNVYLRTVLQCTGITTFHICGLITCNYLQIHTNMHLKWNNSHCLLYSKLWSIIFMYFIFDNMHFLHWIVQFAILCGFISLK